MNEKIMFPKWWLLLSKHSGERVIHAPLQRITDGITLIPIRIESENLRD